MPEIRLRESFEIKQNKPHQKRLRIEEMGPVLENHVLRQKWPKYIAVNYKVVPNQNHSFDLADFLRKAHH